MRGRSCKRYMPLAKHARIGRRLATFEALLDELADEVAIAYGVSSPGMARVMAAQRKLRSLQLCLDGNLEREYGSFKGINDFYFPNDLPEDGRG
jgi:hypothetical protein